MNLDSLTSSPLFFLIYSPYCALDFALKVPRKRKGKWRKEESEKRKEKQRKINDKKRPQQLQIPNYWRRVQVMALKTKPIENCNLGPWVLKKIIKMIYKVVNFWNIADQPFGNCISGPHTMNFYNMISNFDIYINFALHKLYHESSKFLSLIILVPNFTILCTFGPFSLILPCSLSLGNFFGLQKQILHNCE